MVKYGLKRKVRGDNIQIGDRHSRGTVVEILIKDNTHRTLTFDTGKPMVVKNDNTYLVTRTVIRANNPNPLRVHDREYMIEDYLFLVQNGESRGRVMLRVNPKWKPSTWRQYLFEAGHNEEAHALYQYMKEQEK